MSRRAIEQFVDEVWESLPQLRHALATAFRFPNDRLALDKAQGVTHAIAAGAAKMKLEGLSEVAAAQNVLLTRVQLNTLTFDRPLYETLEQLTDLMEASASTALTKPAADSQLLDDLRQLAGRHQSGSAVPIVNQPARPELAPLMPRNEWEQFRIAANEQMREMARRLDLFRRDLNRWDVLADVRRRLHSLRMVARSGGLADFAGLAQHAEDVLQRLLDRSVPANAMAADCLLATIDALEVRVQDGLDPSIMLQIHERLDEVAGERSRYAAELQESFAPPPVAPAATTSDEPVAAAGSPPKAIVFDDRSQLTGEMLDIFSEEADEHLTNIDAALASLEQNPARLRLVQDIRRSAHTLKGAAGAVQLRLVSKLSHRMEDLLDRLVETQQPVSPTTISLLHRTADALHDLASGYFKPEPMRTTVSKLFEQYDAALAVHESMADTLNQSVSESTPSTPQSLVEHSPSLTLPVRQDSVQHDELWTAIPPSDPTQADLMRSHLLLENDVAAAEPSFSPSDAKRLGELQTIELPPELPEPIRSGSTFDTQAEPIILTMSAIESIPELPSAFELFIAPQSQEADEIPVPQMAVADSMALQELSLADNLDLTTQTSDVVETSEVSSDFEPAEFSPLASTEVTETVLDLPAVIELPPTNEIVVRDALPMLAAWSQRPLAEKLIDATTADGVDSEKRQGETLRVPLERVDSLVREIGELLINRTSFETRMSDFLQYVEDLQRAVERLRQASRDLDTKYGVEALGGRQRLWEDDSRRPRSRGDKRFSAKAREEFDALEMDRYTEFHLLSRTLSEATTDVGTIALELRSMHGDFDQLLHRQGRLGRNTQDRLMRIRMVPLMQMAGRLQRTVRTVAEPQGKLVDFVIAGGETEVDKPVLDELIDPLMHLLRNGVDHGIESPDVRRAVNKPERATIRLQAFAQGTQIVLKISDDGAGLNIDAIRRTALRLGLIDAGKAEQMSDEQLAAMIFLPGLSTAATVNEISGRGIGMDVVADKVRKLKGTISVESREGTGTAFTIRLPITLSVTRALLVTVAGETFAIPLPVVVQILRVERGAVECLGRSPVLRLGGEALPLVFLADHLKLRQPDDRSTTMLPVVVIASGDDKLALVVDKILASRDIVVKQLGTHLRHVSGLLGATVLGDGSVVPILDPGPLVEATAIGNDSLVANSPVTEVARLWERDSLSMPESPSSGEFGHERREQTKLAPPIADDIESPPEVRDVMPPEPPVIMVVDDSVSVRRVTANLLKKAGFVAIEAKDGLDALDKIRNARRVPDLFLLDIEMPRMDGFDLLNSLRMTPAHRETPVVMITSRAAEKHRTKARQLGANDYLVKPFHDEHLLTLIGTLLASRKLAGV